MKKKIIALLAGMTAACSLLALTACNESCADNGDEDTNPPAIGGDGQDEGSTDNYSIKLEGTSTSRTIDIEAEDTLRFSVLKNGAAVTGTDAEVEVLLDGDSVTCTVNAGNIKIKPVKVGKTVLTISLKNHSEAASKTFTYTVAEFFFSRDLQRGDINLTNESNNQVVVKRSNDAASLLYKKASKNFVFKATIELPANARPDTIGESFGLASFRDAGGDASMGDNALWFGAKSSAQTGIYSVYQRNFYEGWGKPKDEKNIDGYANRDFGTEKTDIEVEIIRNGFDYYYSVNGMYGKYTDSTAFDEATYPGIYSQHFSFVVKDFSVTMDEEEVIAAAAAYSQKGYATVSIAEKTTAYLVNGKSHTFTGKAYPSLAGDGRVALSWSIVTDELENAGNTAINAETGVLTLAEGATGYVTVKCEGEGGISDSFRVRVRNAVETYQDDLFNYTGGVELVDGTAVFPEEFTSVNGIGEEYNYVLPENKYYALSINTYRGAYSVEFKLSDYKNDTGDKLEVTLGEGNSRFYIRRQANIVEAYCLGTYGSKAELGWFIAHLPAGFDWNTTNTFKFEVTENGTYAVYANGAKLQFVAYNTSTNATLRKSYDKLLEDGKVKIAANGISAKISEIDITQGSLNLIGETYVTNPSVFSDVDGSGFTVKIPDYAAGNGNWSGKYHYATRIAYTDAKWAKLSGSYVIEFDVDFSEAMKDGKLVLKIGEYEYHILNKYADNRNLYGYIYTHTDDWNNGTETLITDNSGNNILGVHVRLEVDANRNVKLYMNDVVVGDGVALKAAPAASFIEFYTYSAEAGEYEITVGNLTLADYSAKSGVLTIDLNGSVDRALSEEESEQLSLTVKVDGQATTDYTLSYQVTGTDIVSVDERTGKVTALKKGKAQVVITVTPTNEAIAPKTITVKYEISDFFFHKNMHRGSYEIIKDAEGSETGVSITAGNSGIAYRKASTQWIFAGKISFSDWTNHETLCVTSVRGTNASDVANNDLWFGISDGNEGKYNIVTREFYGGWAGTEHTLATGYAIPEVNGHREVDFMLIRDGNKYYFVLDNFVIERTVECNEATYPGVFTQNNPATYTNLTVDMTAAGVAQAIADLKANTPVREIKIASKISTLTSGESYEFTANHSPAFVSATYSWSVDTSGVTGGSVTIDQNGNLTADANAEGTVIVKVSVGALTDSIQIELTKEVIPTENDMLTACGEAVSLVKNGAGEYADLMFNGGVSTDGIGNELSYVENTTYSANFKQSVYGDFSVEFTVSEYQTTSTEPKLMVSLGGEHNQFYIVYTENGCEVQTFTDTFDSSNKTWPGGDWGHGAITVNKSQPVKFKIAVVNGVYHVYYAQVGNSYTEIPLFDDNWGGQRKLVRRYSDYTAQRNVRISTKNIESVKVSDITLTQSENSWYFVNFQNDIVPNDKGDVTLSMSGKGWDARAPYGNGDTNYYNNSNFVVYGKPLYDDFSLEFNAKFSEKTGDSKLCVKIGTWEYLVSNKLSGDNAGWYGQYYKGDWGTSDHKVSTSEDLTAKVKITRKNGVVNFWINDALVDSADVTGADTSNVLEFYEFSQSGDVGKTVTISNVTVTKI